MNEVILPHSDTIERAVLGSMLDTPDLIPKVISKIDVDDFYFTVNQKVFNGIVEAYNEDGVVDTLIVSEKLRKEEDVPPSYVFTLVDKYALPFNIDKYIKELKNLSKKRKILVLMASSAQELTNGKKTPEDIYKEFTETLDGDNEEEKFDLASLISEYHDYIFSERAKIQTIKTGFERLDNMLGGIHKGSMITFASKTGVGKTSFAVNLLYNVAKQLIPVYFVSLEMSAEEILCKLLSLVSKVDSMKIMNGTMNAQEKKRVADAEAKLYNLPIFYRDKVHQKISEIVAEMDRLRREKNIGFIIIDYLQLISTRRRENRVQEVQDITRTLKSAAMRLNIPIFVGSQLNREADKIDGAPKLSFLRESGSIEQDSDVVIFLHKEEGIHKLIIAKNRHGRTGVIDMKFEPQFSCFKEIENEIYL